MTEVGYLDAQTCLEAPRSAVHITMLGMQLPKVSLSNLVLDFCFLEPDSTCSDELWNLRKSIKRQLFRTRIEKLENKIYGIFRPVLFIRL